MLELFQTTISGWIPLKTTPKDQVLHSHPNEYTVMKSSCYWQIRSKYTSNSVTQSWMTPTFIAVHQNLPFITWTYILVTRATQSSSAEFIWKFEIYFATMVFRIYVIHHIPWTSLTPITHSAISGLRALPWQRFLNSERICMDWPTTDVFATAPDLYLTFTWCICSRQFDIQHQCSIESI